MKNVLVIGSVNIDTTIYVDHFPIEGESTIGKNKFVQLGGKGANQAVAIANSGLVNCIFKCCVGSDNNGKVVLNELNKYPLKIVPKVSNLDTGTAFIEVDSSSQNKIIVLSGANGNLDKDDIDDSIFNNVDCVVLQNEIPIDTIEFIINKAHALHKTIVFNPAPFKPINSSILKYVDYLVPNESELEQFTKTNDVEKGAKKFLSLGCKHVIVTLGSKGSILFSDDKRIETPAFKVHAIDTVAAGDTFVGYFTSGIMSGMSLENSLKLATKASSICVTRRGSLVSIPNGEEVKI